PRARPAIPSNEKTARASLLRITQRCTRGHAAQHGSALETQSDLGRQLRISLDLLAEVATDKEVEGAAGLLRFDTGRALLDLASVLAHLPEVARRTLTAILTDADASVRAHAVHLLGQVVD